MTRTAALEQDVSWIEKLTRRLLTPNTVAYIILVGFTTATPVTNSRLGCSIMKAEKQVYVCFL